MSDRPARASRAYDLETQGSSETDPSRKPIKEPKALRGEAAWEAARRQVADRNARARKLGKQQRKEHESRIAGYRRAVRDQDGPPPLA